MRKMATFTAALGLMLVLGFSGMATAQPDNQQANFGQLISALNNINVQINELEALNENDVDVNVVRDVQVTDVLNGNNVRALNNALRGADIDALQDVLNNADVAISDVIAVDVLSGGDIVVFQDDR